MHKQEFLDELRRGLSGLPQEDQEERLSFYREMIEDRMEEGLSEQEAVQAAGTVEEILLQAAGETPLTKIVKERISAKRGRKAWEIVLLALGAPVWLPLALAAVVVMLSLYISVWAVILSLWAVTASLVVCALGVIVWGLFFIGSGNVPAGLAAIGAGILCAGLFLFAFCGCRALTKGTLIFTKSLALGIKSCLLKKEER